MIDSHRDVKRFSFATMGLSWAFGMAVCGWLFGLQGFDATMLATSFVVLTGGSAVGYLVLVRALVAELDGAEPAV